MPSRTVALLFIASVVLDLLAAPALGGGVWLPYFSLLLLPFAFTFLTPATAGGLFMAEAIFIWLTTHINLGIIVFSLGMLILFERWILPLLLHTSTWQATILSAAGIILFGTLLSTLLILLPGGERFIAPTRLAIGFTITAGAAGITTALLKQHYVR